MKRLVMPLGIYYLLANEPESMTEYFSKYKDERVKDAGWIRWAYAFSCLLAEDSDGARSYLEKNLPNDRDPILLLLTLYLLDSISPGEHSEKVERFRSRYTLAKVEDEIEKQRANVHVVILARLIEKAKDWLYEDSAE